MLILNSLLARKDLVKDVDLREEIQLLQSLSGSSSSAADTEFNPIASKLAKDTIQRLTLAGGSNDGCQMDTAYSHMVVIGEFVYGFDTTN